MSFDNLKWQIVRVIDNTVICCYHQYPDAITHANYLNKLSKTKKMFEVKDASQIETMPS